MAELRDSWRDWLTAANPFARPQTPAQALRAARMGAVSSALMAIASVVGAPLVAGRMKALGPTLRALMAGGAGTRGGDPAVLEATTNAMLQLLPPIVLGVSLAAGAVMAVLAVVQWRRPNVFIPAILLALSAYGALNLILTPLRTPALAAAMLTPALLAYSVASYAVHLTLSTAGLRGAMRLGRLGRDAQSGVA